MSGCNNKELGQLLHDYELGLLSDQDTHRFEMHLYDCDYCLAQVREFTDISRILVKDPDVRALVEKVAGESGIERDKKKHSPFLKLVIAAILVVIIAIPIYRFGIYEESPGITQILELLPTRTGGSDVISIDDGGSVEIRFFMAEKFTGEVDLLIINISGDTVVNEVGFSEFNDRGLGVIVLPVQEFTKGHYQLVATPCSDTSVQKRTYMFRVK